ncbi:MAG: cytochrome c [Porticoccus sp.]|nr:cytochrome c [Porticoccus sp.]
MKKLAAYQLSVLTGFLCLFLSAAPISWVFASEPDSNRQQELQYLLKQDCGSCHGLLLKGGLGPPLRTQDLKGKTPAYLKQIISKGVPESAMPPWENLLSADDIDYLVRLLKEPLPQGTQ